MLLGSFGAGNNEFDYGLLFVFCSQPWLASKSGCHFFHSLFFKYVFSEFWRCVDRQGQFILVSCKRTGHLWWNIWCFDLSGASILLLTGDYAIVKATKAVVHGRRELGFIQEVSAQHYWRQWHDGSGPGGSFFIPSILLYTFFIIEFFILRDSPGQAGYDDFDTMDASSGDEATEYTTLDIIKRILTNPVIITVALIEFCTGVLRNGIMHWYLHLC